jgi:hypothetical protein
MLEPTGMLDAATIVEVNGPEDLPLGWDQVHWTAAEQQVRRLGRGSSRPRVRRPEEGPQPAAVDAAFAKQRRGGGAEGDGAEHRPVSIALALLPEVKRELAAGSSRDPRA